MSAFLNLALIVTALALLMALAEGLRARQLASPEHTRKLVHLGSGIVVYFLPLAFASHWPVLALAVGFFAVTLTTQRLGGLRAVHGVARASAGAWSYPVVVYALFLLTQGNALLFQIPILILAFSDAFGAVVGKTYGLVRYRVMDQVRSLEGSTAFFVAAFLVTHLPLLLSGHTGRWEAVLIAFVIALLVTCFEAISLGGSDNAIVPLGAYALLNGLLALPAAELELRALVLLVLLALVLATARWQGLSTSGAIGVLLTGYAVWALAGLSWLLPLALFYLSFNALARLPGFSVPAVAGAGGDVQDRERFEISAVFVIATPVLLWVWAHSLWQGPAAFAAFLTATCANSAIAWGTLTPSRWLAGLHRATPLARPLGHWRGLGEAALILTGAALPLLVYAVVLPPYALGAPAVGLAIAGAALALGGKAALGVTLRARYRSADGAWQAADPAHLAQGAVWVGGWRWLTTDRCHALAVLAASALVWGLVAWLWSA